MWFPFFSNSRAEIRKTLRSTSRSLRGLGVGALLIPDGYFEALDKGIGVPVGGPVTGALVSATAYGLQRGNYRPDGQFIDEGGLFSLAAGATAEVFSSWLRSLTGGTRGLTLGYSAFLLSVVIDGVDYIISIPDQMRARAQARAQAQVQDQAQDRAQQAQSRTQARVQDEKLQNPAEREPLIPPQSQASHTRLRV